MERVELKIVGISYNSPQSGSYQLLLIDIFKTLTIPIVIGAFEAQAIAIELEGLKPPRPLTHDLLFKIINKLNDYISEVEIYKLEEGIFYSNIIFNSGEKIDCRTSDAIAVALKVECPIYANVDIVNNVGVKSEIQKPNQPETLKPKKLDELQKELEEAIQQEDYEKASQIKEQIEKLKNE